MWLTKEDFKHLELPDLLLNIWTYALLKKDRIIKKYTIWNIELAVDLWDEEFFLDPVETIKPIYKNQTEKTDLSQFHNEDKHLIYYLLFKEI